MAFTIVGITYLITVGLNFVAVFISSILAHPYYRVYIGGIIVYNVIYYTGMEIAYIIEISLLFVVYILLFKKCREVNDKYLKIAALLSMTFFACYIIFHAIDLSILLSYYSRIAKYL